MYLVKTIVIGKTIKNGIKTITHPAYNPTIQANDPYIKTYLFK